MDPELISKTSPFEALEILRNLAENNMDIGDVQPYYEIVLNALKSFSAV